MFNTLIFNLYDLENRFRKEKKNLNNFGATNIYENDDNYIFAIKLPGCKKNEMDIFIKKSKLIIEGVRKPKIFHFHLKERFEGNFEKTYILSPDINTKAIKAEIKNGLLVIILPKKETAKKIKIPISGRK